MTILAQEGVISWALQPTKYGNGTLVAAKAGGKVTYVSNPANNKLLVVGGTTYTYKSTLSSGPAVANEIKIAATLALTLANVVLALTAGAGSGTNYGTGTVANSDANVVLAYNTLFFTAASAGGAGNALALSSDVSGAVVVGFANGLTAGSFDLTTLSWLRHRASEIDYDQLQDQRIFPLEVGGVITPTGSYKAGSYVGGGAMFLPRLQDTFGTLLLGLMGNAAVTANAPVAGAYTHTFKFNANDPSDIPWLAFRKMIPGRGNVRPQGITGLDNKIAQMRISLPQNDVVSARTDLIGRLPKMDAYADAWLYANEYENADKAAYSCIGSFKLPTVFTNPLPVTSVIIDMVNNVTTPREEMIIGSYNPDDITVRTRSMQIRFVLKWNDPELYNRIYGNAASATDFAPAPFITTYDSGNYGFEADVKSTAIITGTTPYELKVRAGVVAWEAVGPIRLQGGGILAMELRGTVLEPDSSLGVPYAEILLVNGRSSAYSVPAAP